MARTKRVFDVRTRSGTAFLLEDARPSRELGVPCLRGNALLRGAHYFGAGSVAHVPVDEIVNVYEFESVEAFQRESQRVEQAEQSRRQQLDDASKPPRPRRGRRGKE